MSSSTCVDCRQHCCQIVIGREIFLKNLLYLRSIKNSKINFKLLTVLKKIAEKKIKQNMFFLLFKTNFYGFKEHCKYKVENMFTTLLYSVLNHIMLSNDKAKGQNLIRF